MISNHLPAQHRDKSNISALVSNYVLHQKFGRPFTIEMIATKYELDTNQRHLASKALQRMLAGRKVDRLANGTYYRPKVSKFGPLPLETSEILKAVTQAKNATIVPAGAAAINELGLDTQLPMVSSFYVSVRTRIQLVQKSVKLEYKETLHHFVNHFNVVDKDTKRTGLLLWSALTYLDRSSAPQYAKKLSAKFEEAFDADSKEEFISALPPSMNWVRELISPRT